MIKEIYFKFFGGDYRKWTGFLLVFFAIFNFAFGLTILSSILSKYEKSKILPEPTISHQPIRLNDIQTSTTTAETTIKSHYQYYFRIDYTIKDDICVPIHMFNITKNILSIQNLTNTKLKSLFPKDLSLITDIISINPILKKSDKSRENVIINNTKPVCDYIIKLQIGLSFPLNCDKECRLEHHQYLACQIRPFGDPVNDSITFKFYSLDSIISFNISQVVIMESSIYYEKAVYIRSYYSDKYLLELIMDAEGTQLSITMSNKSQSLFLIKDGLYKNSSELYSPIYRNRLLTEKNNILKYKKELINDDGLTKDRYELIKDDIYKNPIEIIRTLHKKINETYCSSLYISFLSARISNSYIKSQDERIVLKRIIPTNQNKQESTFILVFSKTNKDMVAFRSLNNQNYYIAVDPITPKGLILAEPEIKNSDIDSFEKHFLFKFIDHEYK